MSDSKKQQCDIAQRKQCSPNVLNCLAAGRLTSLHQLEATPCFAFSLLLSNAMVSISRKHSDRRASVSIWTRDCVKGKVLWSIIEPFWATIKQSEEKRNLQIL